MANVRIPTPLRRLTNEKDEVNTSSTNILGMVEDLESQFPGIKDSFFSINRYYVTRDIYFMTQFSIN